MSRCGAIDVAKGIGILLVVFGHNPIVKENIELYRLIFSFHVPLFFVLSGVFLNPAVGFVDCFKARAVSILLPYFSVSVFVLLFRILRGGGTIHAEQLLGILYGVGSTAIWTPLWFLPHLFLALLVSLLILRFFENRIFIVFFIVTCWCLGLSLLDPRRLGVGGDPYTGLPWSADLLFVTVPYVLIGYVFKKEIKKGSDSAPLGGCVLFLFSAVHYFFNFSFDLNLRLVEGFAAIAVSLIGIVLVLFFSTFFSRYSFFKNIFSQLGAASLVVLIFHAPIEWSVFGFFQKSGVGFFVSGLLGFVFSIALSWAVFFAARKFYFLRVFILGKSSS